MTFLWLRSYTNTFLLNQAYNNSVFLVENNAFQYIKMILASFLYITKTLLNNNTTISKLFIGGFLGFLCSWGSEHGYYHLIMLPLVVYETSLDNNFSVLGAFDAACLCAPCAGV